MLSQSKCEALKAVNEAHFTLWELVLYLDTHPCCNAGLAKYQQAKQVYHEAVDAYVAQYGPLKNDQVDSCNCWQWLNAPWPWEMED